PAAEPVTLSRNGKEFEYTGQTTIRSGAEVRVDTARESASLTLSHMDDGSWVIFELPGFKTAAAGAEQSSLAALRDASDTSYFKDGDTLWVKLVVDNAGGESSPGPFGPSTSTNLTKYAERCLAARAPAESRGLFYGSLALPVGTIDELRRYSVHPQARFG